MKEKSVTEIVAKGYNAILIALTVTMFVVVTYNVFMRFVLNQSVGWADELARFVFIWLSFLGAALAFRHNEHVGLGYFVAMIRSPRVRHAMYVLQNLSVLVVLGFLTYFGVFAAQSARNVSPALGIRMSTIYYVVPFASVVMFGMAVWKLVDLARGNEPDMTDRQVEEALEEFAPGSSKES